MDKLKEKAIKLKANDFGLSSRKNKRFYVVYNNKIIHFGLKNGQTYFDHHDKKKRTAWRARHSKIISKDGIAFYKIKTSPEYWSYNILW